MGGVIPGSPDQLDDEWLTSTLREDGAIQQAHVTAHKTELAETQGAAGVVARLEMSTTGQNRARPVRWWRSSPHPTEPIRRLLHRFGGYNREIEFYRQFADDSGIPTPHCFHADIDSASGVFVLLLEDMGDARVPDGSGASIEDIEMAVRYLAPFHAKWWAMSARRRTDSPVPRSGRFHDTAPPRPLALDRALLRDLSSRQRALPLAACVLAERERQAWQILRQRHQQRPPRRPDRA
jgi:hypothetical protein